MILADLRQQAAEGDVLDALRLIKQTERELETLLIGTVGRARGEGKVWREIGAALDVSEQAARERFHLRVL